MLVVEEPAEFQRKYEEADGSSYIPHQLAAAY